jgi:diguanylate cyclase (GGDEF)-like protein
MFAESVREPPRGHSHSGSGRVVPIREGKAESGDEEAVGPEVRQETTQETAGSGPGALADELRLRLEDAEQRLRNSEELHRRIAANLPTTGIFLFDRDLRLVLAHGNRANQLGWFSDDRYEGVAFDDLLEAVPEEIAAMAREHYPAVLAGEPRTFEVDSEGMSFLIRAVPLPEAEGDGIEGILVMAHDVTERKRAARALEDNARRQRAAARLGQIALKERNLDRLFVVATRTITETLGVGLSGVLEHIQEPSHFLVRAHTGLPEEMHEIPHDPRGQAGFTMRADRPVVVSDLRSETRFTPPRTLLDAGVVSGMSVPIAGRDEPFGILSAHSTSAHEFSGGEVDFLTTVATMLSAAVERHRDEEASRHAALHDPLTGLPNRTLALDRLHLGLRRRRRDGTDVAVLVMDLDRFKNINDSLGHEAGDELLLALAPRLRAAVRAEGTVARLGGDEFAIVCAGIDGARDAVGIAESLIEAVARPFVLESGERFVTASIGIALADRASDSSESLMRDADVAMYRAKGLGPGGYELFDNRMRARVLSRLRIESELRTAIERGQLEVHYQPIVDVETLEVEALEALVRWRHPRHGLVGPERFIDVAEETGLIVELGDWVLRESCMQMAAWQRRLGKRISISVNVSSRQLTSPHLGASIRRLAEASGMLPGTLALELTESALISESEAPQDTIRGLREHGLMLLLDDFGTGYSSLSHLKRFQLDGIKIDRAFVDGLGADESDSAIVEAILGMAKGLGLRVVAEGVETSHQLARLRDLGCQRAQGYLFSRPLPASRLERFLTAGGAKAVVI